MATQNSPSAAVLEAGKEFDRHESRKDGVDVASCLASALSILRDLLYRRVHGDVEKTIGKDSMLTPVSEFQTLQRTTEEIEIYQAAESAVMVRQHNYISSPDEWYLQWLLRLRLGDRGAAADVVERARGYLSANADDRRHAFMRVLGRALREADRAPLVLFRLLPASLHIATALAFGDGSSATDLRRQQVSILPSIGDCRQCRGGVLECTQRCSVCGNPLWEYEWLTAAD
jgi:hypothetical protein